MKTPEELAEEYVATIDGDYWGNSTPDETIIDTLLTRYAAAERSLATLGTQGTAANGWISVEEELPEEGQKILALEKGDPIVTWFYDKECWEDMSITHWLPIPALPEK